MIRTVTDRVTGSAFWCFVEAQIFERLRLHGLTFLRDAAIVMAAYVLAELMRFDGPIPVGEHNAMLAAVPLAAATHSIFDYLFGVHRKLWRYAGVRDVRAVADACLCSGLTLLLVDLLSPGHRLLPLSVVPMGAVMSLAGLLVVRLWPRLTWTPPAVQDDWSRVLVVGAGHAGQIVVADLLANPDWRERPIGFVDDDPSKRRRHIHGVPVLGTIDQLPDIVAREQIDIVGVAIPSATSQQLDRILTVAQQTPARLQILPSRTQILAGQGVMRLRDIKLDDLLDRIPGPEAADFPATREMVRDRVVLVTGAAGSIGFEICRQILRLNPARLIALDNNETGLFQLHQELSATPGASLLVPVLADIRECGRLAAIFRAWKPDVVFHAAAYKHVPILETHPAEAVSVNVMGTYNLCRLARDHSCERFVFISTDKAVRPVGVLGFSKRIGELLVRHQASSSGVFCSVRFGNVVGSRGSALPEFIRQIDAGGPVTVTHPDVERYFMTIPEAVSLVLQAGTLARGGELFMLHMGTPVKIVDLVHRIIRMRGLRIGKDVDVVFTGLRPGEKLKEELLFEVERTRPTANPSIYAVEDALSAEVSARLDDGVAMLEQIAAQGDPEQIRAALARLAQGLAPDEPARLRSIG